MNKLIALSLVALSATLQANTTEQKVAKAYERQQTTAQVACEHSEVKLINSQFVLNKHIKSNFSVRDLKFSITIKKDGRKFKAYLAGKNLNLIGNVVKKAKTINFNYSSANSEENNIIRKYNLRNMICRVELYKDIPVALTNKKVHINMHPHSRYDRLGVTTSTVESYLNNSEYQNIVLLDNYDLTYNTKIKDFMKKTARGYKLGGFSMPTVKIPSDVEIYAASGGHSLFKIETNSLDVVYTGGNINFCILSSTKRLVDSFMQYSSGGTLNITYDLDGIVAQKKYKYYPEINFKGSKHNNYYVKEEFRKNPRFATRFQTAYGEYFNKRQFYFDSPQNLFSKVTFNYEVDGRVISKTHRGKGTGEFIINMNYINE